MSQMKELNKSPEKDINKTETGKLPDQELKILVLSIFNKLRGRVE